MSNRAKTGLFGCIICVMMVCVTCWIGSAALLEYQVHRLEPSPYPESTFIGIEHSNTLKHAYKEIHLFCVNDTIYSVERFYEDSLPKPCRYKSLPEGSKILGWLSTGRFFAGAVYLRIYPLDERCDRGTLFTFEYVWAK